MKPLDLFSTWDTEDAPMSVGDTDSPASITPPPGLPNTAVPPAQDTSDIHAEGVSQTHSAVSVLPDNAPKKVLMAFLNTSADVRLQSAARIMALGAARATQATKVVSAAVPQSDAAL